MASDEKISIALTPEVAADIRKVVAAGEYASTSEVIRDALRAWKQVRQGRAVAIDEPRRLWREGVESGQGLPLDAEDIKRRDGSGWGCRRPQTTDGGARGEDRHPISKQLSPPASRGRSA